MSSTCISSKGFFIFSSLFSSSFAFLEFFRSCAAKTSLLSGNKESQKPISDNPGQMSYAFMEMNGLDSIDKEARRVFVPVLVQETLQGKICSTKM